MISLVGPLGAGKTAFVKALAEGLGLDPRVVGSPTFVIACEYPLPDGRRLGHVDLYRVGGEDELYAAGFLDLLVPDVVLAVEWGDRIPEALPADHLELRMERPLHGGDEIRRLILRSSGPSSDALAERFMAALGGRVDRLHPGEKTTKVDWTKPHQGNLYKLLYHSPQEA